MLRLGFEGVPEACGSISPTGALAALAQTPNRIFLRSSRGSRRAEPLSLPAFVTAMGRLNVSSGSGSTREGRPQKRIRHSAVPGVSSLGPLSLGGSGAAEAIFDDNWNINIIKYCSDGSVYSETFEHTCLYLMQMASAAAPNPLFQLK